MCNSSLFGIFLEDCLGGAAGVFDLPFEITLFRQIKKKGGVWAPDFKHNFKYLKENEVSGDRDSDLRCIDPKIRQLRACYRVRGMRIRAVLLILALPELIRRIKDSAKWRNSA